MKKAARRAGMRGGPCRKVVCEANAKDTKLSLDATCEIIAPRGCNSKKIARMGEGKRV